MQGSQSNLIVLDLTNVSKLRGLSLAVIAECCKSLKYLEIFNCWKMEEKHFNYFLSNCVSSLERFGVRSCVKMTYDRNPSTNSNISKRCLSSFSFSLYFSFSWFDKHSESHWWWNSKYHWKIWKFDGTIETSRFIEAKGPNFLYNFNLLSEFNSSRY